MTFALFALLAPQRLPAASSEAVGLRAQYDSMLRWRYVQEPVALPPGGLAWTFEGATWRLDSGRLWWAEPAAGGVSTGLVFEGRGRFQQEVPDSTELEQLRRFARRPALATLDLPFSSFVLRFAGVAPFSLGPPASAPGGGATSPSTPLKVVRERQEQWLVERGFDADARVLGALATPGDPYVRMDLKSDEFGWLTYEYDARRIEEIRLFSYNTSFSWEEVWLSLDRPADRDARGRPGSAARQPFDLLDADIDVDLTRGGRDKGWMAGRFQTRLRFRVTADATAGARAVQLYLHPFAKIDRVREGGDDLAFVRDPIGRRDHQLDDRLFDQALLVLLDRPLVPGEERLFDFSYELDMRNYAAGRGWYPDAEGDDTILNDPHTGRLRLTTRSRHEARAMGRRIDEEGEEAGGARTTVWRIDEPTKMLSFVYTMEKFHEEHVAPPADAASFPEVICFGERVGISTDSKFFNVGADVANSLRYFSALFASPLPTRPIYVTAIDGNHGQSFDGFLELSQGSFWMESPGATELFRAHEVAHQWWGHLVGAASYRDAWLGEAFAEYSAMMFVEATVKGGPRIFQEILHAYGDELTGSLKSSFSKFARPGVSLVNRAYGDRIGPIGLGWRANTGEVRTAYTSQVYNKGSLVLHMLRRMVADATGDEGAFVAILRDFLTRHRGGVASTADFEAAVARRVPGDWSWFFDQWVRGTAIPTYRWSYQILPTTNDRGQFWVQLAVSQRDVPAGFKMSVPVEAQLADGSTARTRVLIDRAEQTLVLTFPQRPKKIVFNPEGEVLARTRQD